MSYRAFFLIGGLVLASILSVLSARATPGNICKSPQAYQLLASGEDKKPGGNSGGIGGTGYGAPPGGDGGIGGTGIVGTITGFASICVNGLEVHYDAELPIDENGRPAQTRDLAVGQLVVVEAETSARGLEARKISVVHALEGPVTRISGSSDGLEVMGTAVRFDPNGLGTQKPTLKVGDWVQVSGHYGGQQTLIATRIAPIAPLQEASASGPADSTLQRIGGVPVTRLSGSGGDLTVRGHWDGSRLKISNSRPMAGTHWEARTRRLILETRVRQQDSNDSRTGRQDLDEAMFDKQSGKRVTLSEGTLLRVTADRDPEGKLRPVRVERETPDRLDKHSPPKAEKSDTEKNTTRILERQEKAVEREERRLRDGDDREPNRERPNRIDRPQKTERPDRIERSERIDRVERPERLDRSGHGS